MAKAGFWLQGARGKLKGSSLKGQPGGATIIAGLPTTVTNPNTVAQQGVRSKFKLLSQLGSQYKRIIAIPREGALSSRNLFAKINSDFVTADENGAEVQLDKIQLTKSNIALGNFTLNRDVEGAIDMVMTSAPDVDTVVYVLYKVDGDNLIPIFSEATSEKGQNGTFPITVDEVWSEPMVLGANLVGYAYGIKIKTEEARTKYENMGISTADEVAQVIINRSLGASSQSVTKTAGVFLDASKSEATSTNG